MIELNRCVNASSGRDLREIKHTGERGAIIVVAVTNIEVALLIQNGL